MIYLILAAAVVAALVWLGRRSRAQGDWRAAAGVLSVAALVFAGVLTVRGAWPLGLGMLAVSGWLSMSARRRGPANGEGGEGRAPLSITDAEARSLLGVGPDATREEIQAAYVRLMKTVHPDRGGTAGLAAQLNAARDRLLR
jgi:hypothetical protein